MLLNLLTILKNRRKMTTSNADSPSDGPQSELTMNSAIPDNPQAFSGIGSAGNSGKIPLHHLKNLHLSRF